VAARLEVLYLMGYIVVWLQYAKPKGFQLGSPICATTEFALKDKSVSTGSLSVILATSLLLVMVSVRCGFTTDLAIDFTQRGGLLVILLCAGTKKTQATDIRRPRPSQMDWSLDHDDEGRDQDYREDKAV
jgi:hypothetical protein